MNNQTITSVTQLRENFNNVTQQIQKTDEPVAVLANNKIQFYAISEDLYNKYIKSLTIQDLKDEVKYAKQFAKKYDS